MIAHFKPSVIFTQKAYLAIVAEAYEKIGMETGGVFLGKYVDGNWYVLETLDPGPDSVFRPAYFEYDDSYLTHLSNKTARFYKNGLGLIGLWHRHPGSFSSFSSTDDDTNIKFARLNAHGAISALVNLDPNFRLTVYHVVYPLCYTEVNFKVDDDLIPTDIFAHKTLEDFMPSQSIYNSSLSSSLQKPSISSEIARPGLLREISHIRKLFHRTRKKISRNISLRRREQNVNAKPSNERLYSKKGVLEMIDGEISYLESQLDYNYSLRMQGDGEIVVIVSMEYWGEMPYYPETLRFVFGSASDHSSGYVHIKGQILDYAPGFIQRYINQQIEEMALWDFAG